MQRLIRMNSNDYQKTKTDGTAPGITYVMIQLSGSDFASPTRKRMKTMALAKYRNHIGTSLLALILQVTHATHFTTCQAQAVAQKPGLESVDTSVEFPSELVRWKVIPQVNPVFQGASGDAWDAKIRERGWIVRDGAQWRMYYTGYNVAQTELRRLGMAISDDGIHWKRSDRNPLIQNEWVEDISILKHDHQWIMVAEGKNDIAHSFISDDGLDWRREGPLDIRLKNGNQIAEGPRGTPFLMFENGIWHLFYERGDAGVWLARSSNRKVFTNVQDEPVIALGPKAYDRGAVALNQVLKIGEYYYAVLHANEKRPFGPYWTTTMARSKDLIHWNKCSVDPLIKTNSSSGQIVPLDNGTLRMYTMHPEVRVYEQSSK